MKNIIWILLVLNTFIYANNVNLEKMNIETFQLNNNKMYNHFSEQISSKYINYTNIQKNNNILKLLLQELKNYKEAMKLCLLFQDHQKECKKDWKEKRKDYTLFIREIKKINTILKSKKLQLIKLI